jgi:RNA polymerase sigma factor (TIGR02999 family)
MEESSADAFGALLVRAGDGDRAALDGAFALVYPVLAQIARSYMKGERREHTLQATALINETYLKMSRDRQFDWNDRRHFLGVAARAMRQVLVDHARAHAADKRGGGATPVTLSAAENLAMEEGDDIDFVALDRALTRLEQADARQAMVVQLRYFAGLSIDETAAALDISPATVKREWAVARLWLMRSLERERNR